MLDNLFFSEIYGVPSTLPTILIAYNVKIPSIFKFCKNFRIFEEKSFFEKVDSFLLFSRSPRAKLHNVDR